MRRLLRCCCGDEDDPCATAHPSCESFEYSTDFSGATTLAEDGWSESFQSPLTSSNTRFIKSGGKLRIEHDGGIGSPDASWRSARLTRCLNARTCTTSYERIATTVTMVDWDLSGTFSRLQIGLPEFTIDASSSFWPRTPNFVFDFGASFAGGSWRCGNSAIPSVDNEVVEKIIQRSFVDSPTWFTRGYHNGSQFPTDAYMDYQPGGANFPCNITIGFDFRIYIPTGAPTTGACWAEFDDYGVVSVCTLDGWTFV